MSHAQVYSPFVAVVTTQPPLSYVCVVCDAQGNARHFIAGTPPPPRWLETNTDTALVISMPLSTALVFIKKHRRQHKLSFPSAQVSHSTYTLHLFRNSV